MGPKGLLHPQDLHPGVQFSFYHVLTLDKLSHCCWWNLRSDAALDNCWRGVGLSLEDISNGDGTDIREKSKGKKTWM